MCKILAIIVNAMHFVFVAWNGFWWNYHVARARLHDERISTLDSDWLEKVFKLEV